jgi:putative tryptophan/tyrosine transport system substrate-binding protein
MRRREFIAALGTAAWSRAAGQERRRIGVLLEYGEDDREGQARLEALTSALDRLGWADGRNLHIERRFAGGDPERIRVLAQELAALAPDVILGSGSPVTRTLQSVTRTTPIVFVQVSDPVGAGVVPSLARPGGNVTGFTNFEYAMVGKWLDLLKQVAPSLTRILMLQNPANFGWPGYVGAFDAAAPLFAVQRTLGPVVDAPKIEAVIRSFAGESNGGMIVLPDTTTGVNRKLIVGLAEQYGVPAVYPFRFFATDGGLMSYGVDVPDVFRSAASYVARILHGERPGELPVQAPIRFELILNLKTASQLGLTIPPTLLARADEVIE